jgi:hypothetical protein
MNWQRRTNNPPLPIFETALHIWNQSGDRRVYWVEQNKNKEDDMKHRVIIVICCFLALAILAACDSSNTQSPTMPQSSATSSSQPTLQSQSAPCVTATPLMSVVTQPITGAVGSAQQTTSGAVQQLPSPAELATREAQLESHNRPVTLAPAGSGSVPALPVCPTATPIK